MKRIVFTVAVGSSKFAECALGLGRSLKLIGDTTPRVVITDQPNHPWSRYFDEVLEHQVAPEMVLLSKFSALERTDADQVLFIDSDCLVFKRLAPIFDYCAGRGMCVQGIEITDGHWLGEVSDHLRSFEISSMARFNGGLYYYERTPECQAVLDRVMEIGPTTREKGIIYDSPRFNDEASVSVAMAKSGINKPGVCHLIPDEMDYLSTATGLIGKLDLDVMRNRCGFLCRRFDVRYVEPMIFHASRYLNFNIYWRQLDRLRWLEKYEDGHEFGYMSPVHKMQRSIQRRYLKYIKRVL